MACSVLPLGRLKSSPEVVALGWLGPALASSSLVPGMPSVSVSGAVDAVLVFCLTVGKILNGSGSSSLDLLLSDDWSVGSTLRLYQIYQINVYHQINFNSMHHR